MLTIPHDVAWDCQHPLSFSFTNCILFITYLINIIFRYELRFVAFTWTNLCSLVFTFRLCLWHLFVEIYFVWRWCKLYKHVRPTSEDDHVSLQKSTRMVRQWLLKLNINKCKTVFYGRNINHDYNEKRRSERRKHCTLTVVRRSQKFSPRRRLPFRGPGQPKFNQLEMVNLATNPVWWGSMHAISSYRGNRHRNTHPQTHQPLHTQNHRQDRLQYTAPCNYYLHSKELEKVNKMKDLGATFDPELISTVNIR